MPRSIPQTIKTFWSENMLQISKRSWLSPLAEAPPLDSLCAAEEGLPQTARRPPKRRRHVWPARAETESLELHFLSRVLSGDQDAITLKTEYKDKVEYFSAMSAMILNEAKGILSEMQKRQKGIRCKAMLKVTGCNIMQFDVSQILDAETTETWSAFLAETCDNLIFPVVVRRSAGEHVGVIAQRNSTAGSNGSDFDAWLYPPSAFLGDLWRQWEACNSMPMDGPLLSEILGQTSCEKSAEEVQSSKFKESGLNTSQVQALDMCMSGEQRIHCIQGPPGTGKSQTILCFAECLARAAGGEDLFIVASMTNKACQLLATKFRQTKQTRSIPVALAGNTKKLPADASHLRNIFVHGKGSYFAEQVSQGAGAKLDSFLNLKDRVCDWLKLWAPDTYEQARQELVQARESSSLAAVLKRLDEDLEEELLGRARFLFATLSTLARPQVRRQATRDGQRQVKWVIVDEAGQAVEAQMLPVLLWQPERALLVGDTKQLTATTSQSGSGGYGRSLMSRLEELGQVPRMLNVQYRMVPPISRFPAQHFYNNKLHDAQAQDADAKAMLSDWLSMKCPMKSDLVPAYAFLNLAGTERRAGSSCANDQEAELCFHLASSLLRGSQSLGEAEPKRPTCIIITFYAGQKELLERWMWQLPTRCRPQVHTVDSFQGSEAEQVVISFVRSNSGGRIGFLSDYRRLNVALTRARRSLFLVGNSDFMKSTDGDLANLVHDAESRDLVAEASDVLRCLLPEIYAPPAVTLVPSDVAGHKHVQLTPCATSRMSTSQKIDAPLSALI